MDAAIPLIILLVLGVPVTLAVWLIVRAISARNRIEELSRRLDDLEVEIIRLKKEASYAPSAKVAPEPILTAPPAAAAPPSIPQPRPEPKIVAAQPPPIPPPTIAGPPRATEPKFIP